jgi:hypothetical protein
MKLGVGSGGLLVLLSVVGCLGLDNLSDDGHDSSGRGGAPGPIGGSPPPEPPRDDTGTACDPTIVNGDPSAGGPQSAIPDFAGCDGLPLRMPVQRQDMTAVAGAERTIYLFGGSSTPNPPCRAPLLAFDFDTDRYRTLASAPSSINGTAGLAFAGGKLIALGYHRLWLYDPATNSWSDGAAPPRPLINRATTTGPDGRVYFFGGIVPGYGAGYDNADVYDPATDSWSLLPRVPFSDPGEKAVTVRDRIYLVGQQTASFDPATDQWTRLPAPPTPRYDVGAGVDSEGRIVVAGGHGPGADYITDVVEIYDPIAQTWTSGARMPSPVAGFATATACGGRLYAFGGRDAQGTMVDVVRAYGPWDSWVLSP